MWLALSQFHHNQGAPSKKALFVKHFLLRSVASMHDKPTKLPRERRPALSRTHEFEAIAKATAQAEIADTLRRLGIDPEKPIETQENMHFLRNLRWMARRAVYGFIGLGCVALWIYLGFKH